MGKSGFGLVGFFIYGLTVTSVVNGHLSFKKFWVGFLGWVEQHPLPARNLAVLTIHT
jgi:hypothetical protein